MPKIHTVLSTLTYDEVQFYNEEKLDKLRRAFAPAAFIHLDRNDGEGIAEALKTADVALLGGDLDDRFLTAPNLRWVHCDHAGLNKSARPEVFDRGLIVTSSAGRSGPALADHALFFMLALTFRFPEFLKAQQEHRWGVPGQGKLQGLYGKTVGIVGMGHIGRELAARAKACGMRVVSFRRRAAALPEGVDRMYSRDNGESLDDLLRESDFVVLAVPLSDATYHLLGEREFGLMKPSAYVINMARGQVLDERALLAALREGRIAGAGLDTFHKEPLPPEDPLWDAPNTLITPHFTPMVYNRTERSMEIILDNLRRYLADEPMRNQLTREDIFTPRNESESGTAAKN